MAKQQQQTRTIEIPAGTQVQRLTDGVNADVRRLLRVEAAPQKVGGVTMFYTFTLSGSSYRVPAQYVSVVTVEN